jgi:hypothetical protein
MTDVSDLDGETSIRSALGFSHWTGTPQQAQGAELPVRVVGLAVAARLDLGVNEVAMWWGKEVVNRGRAVSAVLIRPPLVDVVGHRGVASVQVRFKSGRGVPYEGVVSVLRTSEDLDFITECLYPALLHDELFDYAHRELILSARLADD